VKIGVGDFTFVGQPDVVLPADTVAPSLEARQIGVLRALGVGPDSWRGWG
jgi:hypothetical protein